MSNTISQLLALVKSALAGIEPEIFPDVNWQQLYELAAFHSITCLIASAADKIDMPANIRDKLVQDQTFAIYREANQELMVSNLMDDFETAGIDHMPLKGFILKHMYPSIEMRNMCDVDILIHQEEIDKIAPIMEKNGFSFEKDSPHEFIFVSGVVTVELHKSLVPNYNKDLYSYYGDGWRLAKLEDGFKYRYELSFEDFYVYNIVHTAKHYLNGGTGIRQVADIYVMQKSDWFANADKEYINIELQKLGLDQFAKLLSELCNAWFDGASYSKNTEQMSEYILNSGVYGTQERADSSRVYRASEHSSYKAVKVKSFVKMLFPKREGLLNRYPILREKPRLYPIYIVYRWVDVLFHRRSNIKKNFESNLVSDEQVDSFARHCEQMGLRKTL